MQYAMLFALLLGLGNCDAMLTRKRPRTADDELVLAFSNNPVEKKRVLAALAAGANPNLERPILNLPARPILFDLIDKGEIRLLEEWDASSHGKSNPYWCGLSALSYAVKRACSIKSRASYAVLSFMVAHHDHLEPEEAEGSLKSLIDSFTRLRQRSLSNVPDRTLRGEIVWGLLCLGASVPEPINGYLTLADNAVDPSMSMMVDDLRTRLGAVADQRYWRLLGINREALIANNPWLLQSRARASRPRAGARRRINESAREA